MNNPNTPNTNPNSSPNRNDTRTPAQKAQDVKNAHNADGSLKPGYNEDGSPKS